MGVSSALYPDWPQSARPTLHNCVCSRVGVTTDDERIAEWLRPVRNGQPVMVVATKCENDVGEDVAIEAARLGYGM